MKKVDKSLVSDDVVDLKKELKDVIKKNMALYKNCVKLENKIRKRDEKIEILKDKLKDKK